MKKVHMSKKLKIILIVINVIFIGVISFMLYKDIKYPGVKEEKISLYSYSNKANINYEVFLKSNILYDGESIDEGNIYITEFVDYINTNFNYRFSGDSPADIKGDYEIIAEIEGFTGEKETYKTIWKKGFVLLPKTSFDTKDKAFSIKENVQVKLEPYNNFAKQVIKDAKISSKVKLTVYTNVNLKAKTDKGLIEEKMSPTMTFLLNTGFFEITGNLTEEKPGSIDEKKQVQLPVNQANIRIYSSIIGVLLITLIFLVLFTKIAIKDPFEKKLKRIFKNHGDRMVALNSEVAVTCENHSVVKSIDDLVRIADEIGKPIMYKHSLDYKEISKFYINDEAQMYIFDLSKMLINENLDDEKKDKSQEDVHKLKKTISEIKASKSQKKESDTETTESKA